jgi:hypothetical protein
MERSSTVPATEQTKKSTFSYKTLFNLIAIRGNREQAFKFAFGHKGGMKQCYTRGCEIFTPLVYALKGADISDALQLDRMHQGEIPAEILQ